MLCYGIVCNNLAITFNSAIMAETAKCSLLIARRGTAQQYYADVAESKKALAKDDDEDDDIRTASVLSAFKHPYYIVLYCTALYSIPQRTLIIAVNSYRNIWRTFRPFAPFSMQPRDRSAAQLKLRKQDVCLCVSMYVSHFSSGGKGVMMAMRARKTAVNHKHQKPGLLRYTIE